MIVTLTLSTAEFQVFTNIAAQLNRIETAIQQLDKENQKIMATEQDVKNALEKIDQTTTAIGNNLNSEVGTIQTISDDVDQLKAALAAIPGGVSQTLVDQANSIAARLDTVGTNIANQVPVLQAIAQNGQLSTPPPPPPPPAPVGS